MLKTKDVKQRPKNMTLNKLTNKLSDTYSSGPKGDVVVMIHLFGIKYSDEIEKNGYSKKDIIKQSGISTSYQTELAKGMKLAKFVKPRNN